MSCKTTFPVLLVIGFVILVPCRAAEPGAAKIPILYSTDLFLPPDDPDDHYDLATLFALPELDIRGIILDQGARQEQKTGRASVEQMLHITKRQVPCVVGLSGRLSSRADKALEQPAQFQGAVELILKVLRESPEKVTIFTTGSCRDVAAAFNRQPQLFRSKVRACYANVGDGPAGIQTEYNVGLDAEGYGRIFEMGVPLYWCPCFGKDGYLTHFRVDQNPVIGSCVPAVQNFFIYCLTGLKADPIAFLRTGPHPLPGQGREMWCTAPLFHAAGRKIYRRGLDDFLALPPAEARKSGLADNEVKLFDFVPIRAAVDPEKRNGQPHLTAELHAAQPTGYVFHITEATKFGRGMGSCLKNVLATLGR